LSFSSPLGKRYLKISFLFFFPEHSWSCSSISPPPAQGKPPPHPDFSFRHHSAPKLTF
jgi:hypothetical protein